MTKNVALYGCILLLLSVSTLFLYRIVKKRKFPVKHSNSQEISADACVYFVWCRRDVLDFSFCYV